MEITTICVGKQYPGISKDNSPGVTVENSPLLLRFRLLPASMLARNVLSRIQLKPKHVGEGKGRRSNRQRANHCIQNTSRDLTYGIIQNVFLRKLSCNLLGCKKTAASANKMRNCFSPDKKKAPKKKNNQGKKFQEKVRVKMPLHVGGCVQA